MPRSWLVVRAGLDLPTTPWRRYGIAVVALALLTTIGGALIGTWFFEEPRGSLMRPPGGSHGALIASLTIGIATDVFRGSLRQTAMENARLYRHARQADARKDEFLAMLAHELRNPLTPLRNALYLLDACGPNEAQVEELHRMMEGQFTHLVRIVDDLLDVTRNTTGRIELKWKRVETGKRAEDVLNAVRPLLDERDHDLHVTLPTEKTHLRGYRVRLTPILVNLVTNAAIYTPPCGRIWFTVDAAPNLLVVRIRDTGIGFDPVDIERVFNIFEQTGHAYDMAKGGLGIGLTLVRRLVEMHGGSVTVQSGGAGLGSEFTVRLTRIAAPDEQSKPESDLPAPPKRTSPTSLRIVIVEDFAATAKSMSNILSFWQHETKTCGDGFTALEIIRQFRPDVVLADLGLPQMSGYQLAEVIRKLPGMNDVVPIAISGYGQSADKERSQAVGFRQHLVKPINPLELEQILDDLQPSYAKSTSRDA